MSKETSKGNIREQTGLEREYTYKGNIREQTGLQKEYRYEELFVSIAETLQEEDNEQMMGPDFIIQRNSGDVLVKSIIIRKGAEKDVLLYALDKDSKIVGVKSQNFFTDSYINGSPEEERSVGALAIKEAYKGKGYASALQSASEVVLKNEANLLGKEINYVIKDTNLQRLKSAMTYYNQNRNQLPDESKKQLLEEIDKAQKEHVLWRKLFLTGKNASFRHPQSSKGYHSFLEEWEIKYKPEESNENKSKLEENDIVKVTAESVTYIKLDSGNEPYKAMDLVMFKKQIFKEGTEYL